VNLPPFAFNLWPAIGELFLRVCGVSEEEELEKWSGTVGVILFLAFLLLLAILANAFRE